MSGERANSNGMLKMMWLIYKGGASVNTHANPFPGNLVIIKDSYSYSAYSYIANVYFTSDVDGKERTGSLNEFDKIGLNKIREQVCMMIEILIIVNVAIM